MDAVGLAVDGVALALPGVPGGAGLGLKTLRYGDEAAQVAGKVAQLAMGKTDNIVDVASTTKKLPTEASKGVPTAGKPKVPDAPNRPPEPKPNTSPNRRPDGPDGPGPGPGPSPGPKPADPWDPIVDDPVPDNPDAPWPDGHPPGIDPEIFK